MNGFTEGQDSIFNIVTRAGYTGTEEQLFEAMKQQEAFDAVYRIVQRAGVTLDERDFIYVAGVAPKKKDSALSAEYSTQLGFGVEGGDLDVPTDTTVPPSQREDDLSRLASRQEALQGDFFESIFGSRTDPIDDSNFTGTGALRPEEKKAFHEKSRNELAEQFSTEGFVATDGDINSVDYENYHLAKDWFTSRGINLGTPVGPGDIASFSNEIYDTLKDNPYVVNTGATADVFETVIKNSGLLMEDANSTLNVEMRKQAIVSNTFDIGTYSSAVVAEVPTIDTEEGASFFYEPHLNQFNTSYIPTSEEELTIAQGMMPEKLSTFEKASEYYSAFGKELTTEEYNKVAGYYTARSEVVQALDNKRKVRNHIEIFVDEFSGATTKAQQDDVLSRERDKEATVISLYNEANEVLGIERRAYDIFDVVMQMSMDEVFMNGDTAINRYRQSAEYFGRKLDDETYFKNLNQTAGMIEFGFIDLANMIGLTNSTSESVLLSERIRTGDLVAEGGFKDIYGREFEPDMFSWNELSAAMSQNKSLREGLTFDEIEKGVFGNYIDGNVSAANTLFLDGVAAAVPQIAGTIVMTMAGAPEVALVGFAGSASGSAYSDIKSNAHLTEGEKILYSSLMGGFEYVSEKIFMKQELISANALRKMFGIGVKDIAQETAKTTARKGVRGAIGTAWKKTTGNRVFKFFEEGIEEGLVSFAGQQLTNYAERTALDREISDLQTRLNTEDIADDVASNLRSQIAGKEIEKTDIKYNYIETLDAFAIGTAAGSLQMGIVRAPSFIASKFNFKDQLALENKYEALQKRLANETNSEKKAQIKQEMLEIQDQMWRVSARDLAFLTGISDEDLTEISGLNTRIRKNRRKAFDTRKNLEEARSQGNQDAVAVFEAELSALQADTKQAFETKFNIEGKYSQNQSFIEQNLEDPETQAVIDEVGRVDPDIIDYGRVGKGNSVELTGENANSVIDRIINTGKIISTKFSSREEIIRGLQNIKKVIQTVVGQGGQVFIHGTAKAFEKATGEEVSRGIHIKDGNQVHLFLPALKANTAYHEAFHSAAMQIDEKQGKGAALRKLARQFAMALPNAKRYLAFISEYLTEEQQALAEVAVTDELARKLLSQIVEQNAQAAEELVVEILADITNGDLSAEYKQGLITSLKNYVGKLFGTEFKDPTLKNVANAIKSVTTTMEAGLGVAGMQRLAEATEDLKDVPTITTDDDTEEELKSQAQKIRSGDRISGPVEIKTKEFVPEVSQYGFRLGGTAYIPVSVMLNFQDRGTIAGRENYQNEDSRRRIEEIKKSLLKDGYDESIPGDAGIVLDVDSQGYAKIIEGNHRLIAMDELGMNVVPTSLLILAARDEFRFPNDNPLSSRYNAEDMPRRIQRRLEGIPEQKAEGILMSSVDAEGNEISVPINESFAQQGARSGFQIISPEKLSGFYESAKKGKYHIGYVSIWETNLVESRKDGDGFLTYEDNLMTKEVGSVNEAESNDNTAEEGKSAQKIVETVADMLTEKGFNLVMEGKGKDKKLVLKSSNQINLFKMKKDEILQILQDSGMKKEQAEKTYKNAVQFARGRRAARKEAAKIASQARRREGKLSTEAKNLRKQLQELKDKSKSLQEFFNKAKALIKERMKDRKTSDKFTAAQLNSFFTIAGQMARTSAKRLSENELDIIDSFLDKIATIFDKQDAKKAMDDHLDLVKSMRKLQKTLVRKSKQKDFGAYRSLARIVAGINPSLIPVDQMQSFSDFVNDVNNSMKRARFSKDEEGNLVVTASNLKEVKSLMAIATNFKAIEEVERDANFRARATKAVEAAEKAGKSTTFEEEYKAILEKYQRSRLSPTRKKIEDTAKKLGLDVNNVQDLEIILDELAKDSAELAENKKDLILSDAIIPRVMANLEELLQDTSFRTILGLFSMDNVSAPELKARLMQLDMRHLAALEYKINDYLVNSSTIGLGYLASIVRGKISLASDIKALVAKGVRSKDRSYGSFADNVPSFIRNVFKVGNVDVAKILVAIGFQDVMSSVNLHEQAHMERVTALQNKIDEITEKGGEITSDLSNAIAQIFSMANQKPEALSEAEWFMNLRDAMDSTIQEYEVEQSDIYDPETIQEFKDAREYLFGQTNNLQELLDKVRSERTDIVEIVDFLSQMHESMRPDFENFTERYLGKTLEVLENYTPFKVRKKGFDDQLDSVMEIRRQLISALSSAGNSNYTKTPGATFEREARAVGGDSILGLNFLKINEATLRQNSFIMMSLEDVLAMKYAFQTEAMQGLMPKSIKAKLSEMIDNYLVADATEVPFIFQKNIRVGGKTIRNPFEMFRVAAVVNAFGGVFVQFFKQSTVMLSAFANTKTLQGKAYLIRTFGEMLALTFIGKDKDGKLRVLSDPKVKINDGRYELLRHTTLFLRDYKAGNIDPFTGRVEFDKSRLDKTRDWLQDKSMWTLTTTDKVAAISSFYAFYADFLLSEGVVNDISEINWGQEAANPNMEAIAYAENIVSKDQNVSSSRLAANVYKNKSAFVRFLVQTMLPFQSFAINTKRSITGDIGRIIDPVNPQARKDGLRGLAGTTASLFVFAYISRVMTALISEFVKGFGDDDDESNLDEILTDPKTIRESAVQTVLDAIPLPSTPAIDNKVKDFFNYYFFFNASDYDAPGLEDKDAFELFKQYGDAVTTYETGVTDKKGPVQNAILTALSALGPGGKFAMDLEKMLEPTLNGGTSYTTGSGRERFIRPEDQADFMLSNTLRTLLSFANLAGVGVKELDYVAKALDDMPKDRALSSEEQLAAFETILIAIGNDPETRATIEGMEGAGPERLLSILQKQAEEDPVTLARGLSQAKFKSALKQAVGDKVTEMMFPQEYKKYSAEVRRISRRSPKEIAAVIRGKEGEMNPDDFKRYNNFLLYYIALNSEATFNNVLIELDINTVE
tara:strand:+ start:18365 stop:27103 length:8739 start_codon:yes stop_codon:yes gene_type:complete